MKNPAQPNAEEWSRILAAKSHMKAVAVALLGNCEFYFIEDDGNTLSSNTLKEFVLKENN